MSVDQGTTNTKALLIDESARIVAVSESMPIRPSFPRPGWVEYDPREMLDSVYRSIASLLSRAEIDPRDIRSVGFANQGETVIAFDTVTGDPIYPAISWQDNRNAKLATELRKGAEGERISQVTGLFANPYFSALKMRWILDNVPSAKTLLATGRLCLGTSDVWLLNRLTSNSSLATDISTASRTLLLDITALEWDEHMADLFGIPLEALPDICENHAMVGSLDLDSCDLHAPIGGVCVDQQAALFGEGCTTTGDAKITYGTGCFLLANIGAQATMRAPGILTSVGWSFGKGAAYVLDGGIYNAGSVMRWIVEDLKLASSFAEMDEIVRDAEAASEGVDEVYFVPALYGLASPYWKSEATGSWHGLTGATRRVDLIRSAVEAVAYRVRQIVEAVERAGVDLTTIKVDGGPSSSEVFMQLQADVLGKTLEVFGGVEATAYGAGLLSGVSSGLWDVEDIPRHDAPTRRFSPGRVQSQKYEERYGRWKEYMNRSIQECNNECSNEC